MRLEVQLDRCVAIAEKWPAHGRTRTLYLEQAERTREKLRALSH
jgi:hypothetical protein